MNRFATYTLVSVLALAASTSTDAGLIADVAADFTEPAAAANYSYWQSDAANGGTEAALTAGAVGNAGNNGFGGGGAFNTAIVVGTVEGNNEFEIFGDGFEGNAGVEDVDLLLHPGNSAGSDAYVIVRRTITAADLTDGTSATIAGSFRNLVVSAGSDDSVEVFIYKNDTQLFTAVTADGDTLTQTDGTFNETTTIADGDTIDFVVSSLVGFSADETALRATITTVPEPGSLALLGLGGLALVRRRRA